MVLPSVASDGIEASSVFRQASQVSCFGSLALNPPYSRVGGIAVPPHSASVRRYLRNVSRRIDYIASELTLGGHRLGRFPHEEMELENGIRGRSRGGIRNRSELWRISRPSQAWL